MPGDIYLFYGDDKLLISSRLSDITNKLYEKGLNIVPKRIVFDDDTESLIPFGDSLNLSFSDTKYLTTVEIPFELLSSLNDLLCTEFVQYLNNSKESNVFLILVDFDKHDKHTVNQFQKSKLFLALKDIAIIESHFKLKPWEMNEIKSFVLKTSQKYNLSFNADSLNMFCECFSDKTEQIPSEIYKIYTYLLPDSKITKNVLDNLYSNNLNLDDLISCFLKSTYDGVFDDMDKIKKLLPPVYIISVMQSKIRQCFQIKTLLSFGLNQSIISSNLGIHPYKLKLTIQSLTDVSLMDIKKCLNHLSVIEYKLKTGIIKDSNILDMLIAA